MDSWSCWAIIAWIVAFSFLISGGATLGVALSCQNNALYGYQVAVCLSTGAGIALLVIGVLDLFCAIWLTVMGCVINPRAARSNASAAHGNAQSVNAVHWNAATGLLDPRNFSRTNPPVNDGQRGGVQLHWLPGQKSKPLPPIMAQTIPPTTTDGVDPDNERGLTGDTRDIYCNWCGGRNSGPYCASCGRERL